MHNTLFNQRRIFLPAIIPAAFTVALLTSGGASQSQTGEAQVSGRDVTILVTAMPQNDRARAIAAKLQPEDFVVTEEKRSSASFPLNARAKRRRSSPC